MLSIALWVTLLAESSCGVRASAGDQRRLGRAVGAGDDREEAGKTKTTAAGASSRGGDGAAARTTAIAEALASITPRRG